MFFIRTDKLVLLMELSKQVMSLDQVMEYFMISMDKLLMKY